MVEEVWKDIPGYEGYYQVSNLGFVRSLDREMVINHPIGGLRTVFKEGKLLKNKLNNHGKIMVSLSKQNQVKEVQVHRLVLLAFIGEPSDGRECCHKNDNQTDNRLENLYWGTRMENIADKYRNGKQLMGSEVITHKLKECEVWLIKKLLETKKYSDVFISKMFRVDITTIQKIKCCINWKHVIYSEEV